MRTKEHQSKKNENTRKTERYIDRLVHAGIYNTENLTAVTSVPADYADEMISGLITLNKANILTDENRHRISTHPEHAWILALAMVGLSQINSYTVDAWVFLDQFPQIALSFLFSMGFLKNIDLSPQFSQHGGENGCNYQFK